MRKYIASGLNKIRGYFLLLKSSLKRSSLVEEWRSNRYADKRFVEPNIQVVKEEISLLEEYLEQNSYNLEPLNCFLNDDRGYSSPEKLGQIIQFHHSRYNLVMNENPRFRNTVPPSLLLEYRESMDHLDSLAGKAACKHS